MVAVLAKEAALARKDHDYVSSGRPKARRNMGMARVVAASCLLALGAFLAWKGAVASTAERSVLVVTTDLPPGDTLDAAELAVVESGDLGGLGSSLVDVSEKDALVGVKLRRWKSAGEPLLRGDLGSHGTESSRRLLEVSVSSQGSTPNLEPGELVDVLATFDKESDVARTVVVASGVKLLGYLPSQVSDGRESVEGGAALASEGLSSGRSSTALLEARAENLLDLVYAAQNGVVSLVRAVPGEDLPQRMAAAPPIVGSGRLEEAIDARG